MLAELKALLKSPKLWITIIGVSLIPALYNLIFLSLWQCQTFASGGSK